MAIQGVIIDRSIETLGVEEHFASSRWTILQIQPLTPLMQDDVVRRPRPVRYPTFMIIHTACSLQGGRGGYMHTPLLGRYLRHTGGQ